MDVDRINDEMIDNENDEDSDLSSLFSAAGLLADMIFENDWDNADRDDDENDDGSNINYFQQEELPAEENDGDEQLNSLNSDRHTQQQLHLEEWFRFQWEELEHELQGRNDYLQSCCCMGDSKNETNMNENSIHNDDDGTKIATIPISLYRPMLHRELLAGMLKREELLFRQYQSRQNLNDIDTKRAAQESTHLHHVVDGDDEEDDDDGFLEEIQPPLSDTATNTSQWNNWIQFWRIHVPQQFRCWYQHTIFEWYTILPASISLLCHCAAIIAFYDLMVELERSTLNWLHRQITLISSLSSKLVVLSSYAEAGYVDLWYLGCIFLIGLCLLHSTGYLYWWLSNIDFNWMKFDAHNRIRLRAPNSSYYHDVDVRLIQFVRRQSSIVRLVLYMIGYYMVYIVSDAILACTFPYFGQQETILRYLPSSTFRMDLYETVETVARRHSAWATSTHPYIPTFVCLTSCDDEMHRRQSAFHELLRTEQEYTDRALVKSSYLTYWQTWIYSWGNVYDFHTGEYGMVDLTSTPLFNGTGEIRFAIVTFILGIAVLRWYGFVFWKKY
jgi:hypothetical protein